MKNYTLQVLAATVTLLAVSNQHADAGIVLGAQNEISYENRENVINKPGGVATSLEVGDRITGILFANFIDAGGAGSEPLTPETTGVFDLTVEYVIDVATRTIVADPTTFTGTAFVLLRPTNVTGVEGALAGHAAGTAFALYEGGPTDVIPTLNDGSKTTADVYMAASDGVLLGDFGFGLADGATGAHFDATTDWGAPGNGYWYAKADYAAGATDPNLSFHYGLQLLGGSLATFGVQPMLNPLLPANSDIPTFNTLILGNKPTPFGLGTTVFDFVGRGFQEPNTAIDPDDRAKFALSSNDPAIVHPNTPEPGSMVLALVGAACAIPVVRRRRKNREQVA